MKFFKEDDIEQAIDHWNMVQANLRLASVAGLAMSQASLQPAEWLFLPNRRGLLRVHALAARRSLGRAVLKLRLAEQILREPESAQERHQSWAYVGLGRAGFPASATVDAWLDGQMTSRL